jgi:hypothetical protein
MSTGHDVSNLATWGWEWHTEHSDYQLFQLKGVSGLRMGTRVPAASMHWQIMSVVSPGRFGADHAARSTKEWRAIVTRWFEDEREGGA